MKRAYSNLALLITAMIWGSAFVAQRVGMDYVGAFTFQSIRSFLGAAALIPFLLVTNALRRRQQPADSAAKAAGTPGEERRHLLIGGLFCGLMLTVASLFQQIGIAYTTVGKSGFITSMYLILVPVLGIFLRKRVPEKIWGCVVAAAVGLYFLSIDGSFSLSRGDTLTIICAFCFAIHILCVDYFVAKADSVRLSFLQLLTSGILSGVLMLAVDHPTLPQLRAAALPILYAGILSSGVGYTLQVVGQKGANPTTATLLMSLESVFSVAAGILILRQVPSLREAFGCVLIFAAVIFAQIPVFEGKTQGEP